MSFLNVVPDSVSSAAGHLGAIGSALSAANASALGPTTGAAAMAADEVSAAVQSIFAAHAHGYQSLSAHVATFHSQFVDLLNGGAAAYLSSEIANAHQILGGVPAAAVTDTPPPSTPPPSTPPPPGPTVTTLGSLKAGPVSLALSESVSPNGTSLSLSGRVGRSPVDITRKVPRAAVGDLNAALRVVDPSALGR
jgi:PE family